MIWIIWANHIQRLNWTNQRHCLNDTDQSQTSSKLCEPITDSILIIWANHRQRLNDADQSHTESQIYRPITDSVLLIWANYRQRLNDVGQSQTTSQLYEPITYIISNISTNHRHRLNDTGQSQTASHVYLRVYVYLALTSCRRGVEEMQWNSSITYNPHSTQQLISCLEGSGRGGGGHYLWNCEKSSLVLSKYL